MTPERHRQVGELFDEALKLKPSPRAEFLQHACAGDDDLRREVESLLDPHEKVGELLGVPAFEVAAKALAMAEDQGASLVGHHIGGYHILSFLGRGGMGAVYCAQDMKLGREVALKVLTNTVASDREYRLRFEEEARLPSRLNHVNIVTIYGVGEEGDVPYIAMELVRGRTLRQILADGVISVKKALDLATQIAEALAAAHAGGVVHRDLKPENVMVTPEGLVKVLDFGLATRYNLARGAFALTPSVSVGVPSHNYNFRGEAVLGRHLKEVRVAIDAGQRLDAISSKLSVQGRYSYAFVERVIDIPNNRSNVTVEPNYLLTRKLSAQGSLSWQRTHGGLRFGPGEVNTPEKLFQHDRLLRDNHWSAGGGFSYSFPRMDVFASYSTFVSGTDAHTGRTLTFGISWPFRLGAP